MHVAPLALPSQPAVGMVYQRIGLLYHELVVASDIYRLFLIEHYAWRNQAECVRQLLSAAGIWLTSFGRALSTTGRLHRRILLQVCQQHVFLPGGKGIQ